MDQHSIIFTIFLIFTGAAVFATLALYTRQSLLVAYMLFGIICGPAGFRVIPNVDLIHRVDDVGIILLMFLLGLHLKPQSLLKIIGKTLWITVASSTLFFILGFLVGYWYGYSLAESFVIGSCMMFSSTIVSFKLLPDNLEKCQHVGEMMIGILLLQDLIAIAVLLSIDIAGSKGMDYTQTASALLAIPIILIVVFLIERFILKKVFARFAEVREYMFLVAIAWCLGIAQLAKGIGLSYEIGAFIAGVTIAASPVASYIAGQMQPIRDFFLVLFFFIIGASFNFRYLEVIFIPALILAIIFLVAKPIIFQSLIRQAHEAKGIAQEIGVRLGQLSEFSLLVIFAADRNELIGHSVVYLIQAVTMLMFILSSYFVVLRYPIKHRLEPVLLLYRDKERQTD